MVLSGASSVSFATIRCLSREFVDGRIGLICDGLLEGDGGCGTAAFAIDSRSLSRLSFLSLLVWRLWRSITNSMLSKWRAGTPLSMVSDFTGVMGRSRREYELPWDFERDNDAAEVEAMDISRMSGPELGSLEISRLVTRSGSKSGS